MSSYFDYQSRKTRPREQIREDIPLPEPEPEPMEVEETDVTRTWIGRIFGWPKGTP